MFLRSRRDRKPACPDWQSAASITARTVSRARHGFDMHAHTNILLIRLKSIGDILFTLPAVHRIRENFPEVKISFLVSKEHAPLLEGFRDVNEVLTLDRALYRRGSPKSIVMETLALVRRIRRGKFSLAVDFQGYGETGLIAWCTRAPERWGSVYKAVRGWTYTRRLMRNDAIHPVEWNLSLLQQCGLHGGSIQNEFVLPDGAAEEAHRLFVEHGLAVDSPTLFIQPFTSSPQKNWPLGNYVALARYWRDLGWQVIFGGGPNERDALEPVRQAGFPLFAGTPLLVSAGLTNLCTLVLGGDTGLLHLAVAMNKRVVMIMESIAPGSTHPFQHQDWAVTPLSGRNVAGIGVEPVIEACARAMAEVCPEHT